MCLYLVGLDYELQLWPQLLLGPWLDSSMRLAGVILVITLSTTSRMGGHLRHQVRLGYGEGLGWRPCSLLHLDFSNPCGSLLLCSNGNYASRENPGTVVMVAR